MVAVSECSEIHFGNFKNFRGFPEYIILHLFLVLILIIDAFWGPLVRTRITITTAALGVSLPHLRLGLFP